jgi:hypothetical protein
VPASVIQTHDDIRQFRQALTRKASNYPREWLPKPNAS